jgi:hypothetical protein
MKVSPQVKITADANGAVLMDLERGKYYSLNGIGLAIWRALVERRNEDAIAAEICSAYEVPVDVARHDVKNFLCRLADRGLLNG